MDRLPHLDRTLDESASPRWASPAADATHLVRTVHAARRLPLGELGSVESRLLVSQQVALPYVLPLAVRLPRAVPLLDAFFSPGDLLLATVCVPATAWAPLPDVAAELRARGGGVAGGGGRRTAPGRGRAARPLRRATRPTRPIRRRTDHADAPSDAVVAGPAGPTTAPVGRGRRPDRGEWPA
ncbi:contact-dependent growth inhibition system immunity protein [Streptomyces buecherae]|uniref:contact-dependent growth inhibition system immunity protein n=1 Tax=Streptomyces buecherae TaxID=2763006 RepID=UPI001E51FB2D|nr:contact-dependent growth inhibition system immunity protein [Streptomyces buecherae]